ncbi:MAG: glycoside hydrolase family 3 C-terminal domain-containing protein [Firmicutes bacterium]|nr:glycoside hydrolase family 3 C-terminal domain-containing protein [Bacillota bacterium]
MKKLTKRLVLKIVACAVTVLLFGVAITATVIAENETIKRYVLDNITGYKSTETAENRAAVQASAEELVELMLADGAVLAQNNGTLPLAKSIRRVNVFGWSSTVWVAGGSGSGRVTTRDTNSQYAKIGILEALENYGVEYNQNLASFYRNYGQSLTPRLEAGTRPNYDLGSFARGTLKAHDFQYSRIIEPSITDYGSNLLNHAQSFSDTALVVLSRVSGESNDSPKVQYKGNIAATATSATPQDATRHYLEISTEEEDMLRYVGENFTNAVVLINSTNTMELGFMDFIPGLDACLIVGATGIIAASAIPKLLYGDISPSGRTAATYAYDLTTAPSWTNTGHVDHGQRYYTGIEANSGLYPIGDANGNFHNNPRYEGISYVDYQESIYVGYKWYETAYIEGFWDDPLAEWNAPDYKKKPAGATGYDAVVQYPFGHGLSYGDFVWSIENYSVIRGEDEVQTTDLEMFDRIRVNVRVTNRSSSPAKEVVQLYYTPPYSADGGIEKAYVNLAAFGKTPIEIYNHGFVIVPLEFSVYDMASFDMRGAGGYVVEGGEYTVKIMDNAHRLGKFADAADAEITFNVPQEGFHYDTDPLNTSQTAASVKNRFTGDAAKVENGGDGVPMDGSEEIGGPVQYLSRANFKGTYPHELRAARAYAPSVRAFNRFTQAQANEWSTRNQPSETVRHGQSGTLRVTTDNEINELGLALGADYFDERWDTLLRQMTLTNMRALCLKMVNTTRGMTSIGKLENPDLDGPNMYASFHDTLQAKGEAFPNATVVAQTFNKTLVYKMGLQIGSEAKAAGNKHGGWYAPGVNIHRSPLGGRNYEYYSEDGYLSGMLAAEAIAGAKNNGIYSYLKHLVLYDQENNRDSLYSWCTEQAMREIYLKPFRLAIHYGGCTGIMTAYNRLGALWAGGSEQLLTGVVREELGFKGAIVTDYVDRAGYMMMSHALRGGGDIAINGAQHGFFNWDSENAMRNDPASLAALRRANKNVTYVWLEAHYTESVYDPDNDLRGLDVFISGGVRKYNFNWINHLIVPFLYLLAAGVGGTMLYFWWIKEWLYAKKKRNLNNSEDTLSDDEPKNEPEPESDAVTLTTDN